MHREKTALSYDSNNMTKLLVSAKETLVQLDLQRFSATHIYEELRMRRAPLQEITQCVSNIHELRQLYADTSQRYLILKLSVQECDQQGRALHHLMGMLHVPALSEQTPAMQGAQEEQVMTAFYHTNFGKVEDEELRACHMILLRAWIHGFLPRMMGRYDRSGNNCGNGATVRKIKNRTYDVENLPEKVLGRTVTLRMSAKGVVEYVLQGRKKKGYRGKYPDYYGQNGAAVEARKKSKKLRDNSLMDDIIRNNSRNV